MFTPEQGADEPNEVWYLFGAWLLAATMNAFLTWWGVSVAMLNHGPSGNTILGQDTIMKVMPVFVAVMVWLIRVLIIGTFSLAGDRIFSQSSRRTSSNSLLAEWMMGSLHLPPGSEIIFHPTLIFNSAATFHQYRKRSNGLFQRPEPTYHRSYQYWLSPEGRSDLFKE
jgi:hypothetical protein